MKRAIALVLVGMFVLCGMGFAEGKLSATQKNLLIFDNDDNGYFYTRIENVGDEAIGVGSGTLVTFNAEDEIIFSKNYISSYPSGIMLEPGEYVYMKDFIWESALKESEVADYKFSVETRERGNSFEETPCEVSFELSGTDSYDNYIYVTFSNPTEETKYGYYVTAALSDAEGNLLFVDGSSVSSLGVHPNSTVTIKIYIDNDLMKYYAMHDLEPVSADAKVYCEAE